MLLSDFAGRKGIKPYFQETLDITGERMAKHGLSTCCSAPFLSCSFAFSLFNEVHSHRRRPQAMQLSVPAAGAYFSGALYLCR